MIARFAWTAAVLLGLGGNASAQTAARVVLAAERPGDPLVTRLYDELVAMGLDVEAAPLPDVDDDDALRTLATERGAAAVARVRIEPLEVTIWVGDDDEPHRTSGNDRATVALAAAEVLRGYLVAGPAPREPATGRSDGPGEAGMTPATERDAGESTATEPTIADDGAGPEGTTVTARAGLAVFLSAGGVSDQLAIELGVAARVAGNAHLEVVSAVGVPGATITGKREDTPVWTATLGAGLGYVLLGDEGPLTLVASAGIAGLLLLIEDNEKTLVRGAALPYLHAAAGVRIVDGLSARFDATGAIALPEPEVRLSAGRRPSFGRPLVTLGLGLALDW